MLIVVGAENNEKSHVLEGLQLVLFILLDAWCVVNGSVVPTIDYYESLGIKEKGKTCRYVKLPANIQVVAIMFVHFNHVAIKLQLQILML